MKTNTDGLENRTFNTIRTDILTARRERAAARANIPDNLELVEHWNRIVDEAPCGEFMIPCQTSSDNDTQGTPNHLRYEGLVNTTKKCWMCNVECTISTDAEVISKIVVVCGSCVRRNNVLSTGADVSPWCPDVFIFTVGRCLPLSPPVFLSLQR